MPEKLPTFPMSPLEAGLAAINSQAIRDTKSETFAAQCRALLHGYDKKYVATQIKPVLIEKMLHGPTVDPVTNKRVNGWKVAGKIDVVCKDDRGNLVLFDHKTTSEDIEGLDSRYWKHLAIDGQVSHYMLLLLLNGMQVSRVLWDVMRKPTIRQKIGESLQQYEERLTDDCVNVRPDFYFQRQIAPQLEDSVLEYAKDLPVIAGDIRDSRKRLARMRVADPEALPPKSTGACFLYNTQCKFFGLCAKTDSLDNWVAKDKKHAELPDHVPGDLLTHSRIRCLQACERKHYYEYELGIKRPDEEDADALRFGTLWHLALEHWLGAQTEGSVV
jgi:hypothetical protein